jgi:hypothetical protein
MRFYFSHPIRGGYGKNATATQIQKNCEKAILIANMIRNAIPSIELYVPAESEPFVGRAYIKHYLTEQQILDIDCSIISNCEGVICYVPPDEPLQGGRKVELNYADKRAKWIFIFDNVEQVINALAEHILRC